jgi:hypothetical protein
VDSGYVCEIARSEVTIPGTFLINLGNIMRRWSNERFLSTPDGVLNELGTVRYSIAYFYSPNPNTAQAEPPSSSGSTPSSSRTSVSSAVFLLALTDRIDLAFPELGVRLLDRAEASVDLRQLGVLLGLRHRSVERGAVDLALQIGLVALARIFLGHFRFPVGCN